MHNLKLKAPFDPSLDRFIPACLIGRSVVHFLYEYPNEQTSLCGRTGGWYWITPAPGLATLAAQNASKLPRPWQASRRGIVNETTHCSPHAPRV
jgi:hypothetical protein